MTGYGRGEASDGGMRAVAEVRSVNNRYLEVSSKLPRTLTLRDNEVKDLVRSFFSRGKVSVLLTITSEGTGDLPLAINTEAIRSYRKLLSEVRRAAGLREKITLDHLLTFPDILDTGSAEQGTETEWHTAREALRLALEDTGEMRRREGAALQEDLRRRIHSMEETVATIETMSRQHIPQERERLKNRLAELLGDTALVDSGRLEMELALFADKIDITEECVRFRCHTKFFIDDMNSREPSGRKLTFLVQEMNREVNTVGSKAADANIAHLVVAIKEELEKIREQLQNIE